MEHVLRDFQIFGEGDFDFGRRGDCFFVTSECAWIPKPTDGMNVFKQIYPLGRGLPNFHRSEIMIAAYCAKFAGYIDGELVASSGEVDVLDLKLKPNALVWDNVIHNRP